MTFFTEQMANWVRNCRSLYVMHTEKKSGNLLYKVDWLKSMQYNLFWYGKDTYKGDYMATTRLDIRLDEEIKAKAEKASALLGLKSLTEYVVRLMDENATQVILQHESIEVKNDIFDEFLTACDNAKAPNQALIDAVQLANKSGIK